MLDISKLKVLENKRFVCLVRYKIFKGVIYHDDKGNKRTPRCSRLYFNG